MFRKLIKEEIAKIVPLGTNFSVEVPEIAEHGDYASNIALVLAKKMANPPTSGPKEIAEELKIKVAPRLCSGRFAICSQIEIAGPGFLNFFIKPSSLTFTKNNSHELFLTILKNLFKKKKTVIVEYFQLNIAKRPHVGHMRSAIIGDALKRMFNEAGYNAVSDTHVGDWGTQFGILLLALKESVAKIDASDPFGYLENLYTSQNEKILQNPELREKAKEEFAKLERGDLKNRKIWREMVKISMKNLEESVELLGLLPFDEHKGESSYEKDMPGIAKKALKIGIAQKNFDGALVVDLANENLDEAVLIKSDGASTYLLRDLATIEYRNKKWSPHKNLYIVDVRQEHHFNQIFSVAKKMSMTPGEHVSYGFVKLPEGVMSTRLGNAISIDDVVMEAQNRALKIIEEKNPDLKNKKEVAKQVGLGALKYFDLSHNRRSDIEFRWNEALSFEGNTGPYIQYTYARLKSILRKTNLVVGPLSKTIIMSKAERQLAVLVSRFDETLEDSLADYMPNILANYLYGLAQKANEFYHLHPVLQESDEEKKQFRLVLISKISETLKKGLYLLGIDSPEEM